MKKFILLLAFAFSTSFIEGQITFFKTITGIDEYASCIEQTTDGGYIIAGSSVNPFLTNINGLVVKTNPSGDTIWTKAYGSNSRLKSGMQTNDGGYIFLGSMRNSTMFDYDIYVLKIDSVGTIQWQKIIGLGNDDYGSSIKQTSDGGYVLIGSTNSIGAGLSDICAIKLDGSGNLQWNNILGSPDYESGASIEETNDGGYIIIGEADSASAISKTCLIKLYSSGVLEWTKTFGGSVYDKGLDVLQASDSGYMILGNSNSNLSITKTDSIGNIIWCKEYTGASAIDKPSIKKTSSGNYIVASSLFASGQSKLLYTLVDNNGAEIWSRFMGYNTTGDMGSIGSYAQQTTDGGYIFTGYSTTTALQGFIYFIKANSLGKTGCDSTVTLSVNIFSPPTSTPSFTSGSGLIIASTTYGPESRSDSIHTYCTTVGISELPSTPQINVYPNPSAGQFNFSGLEKENKIEVFDITGRIIYQSIANSDFETINISDKAKGIYFYRITKEMKLVQCGKICVQ